MRRWAAPIVALAARARPLLVRCHGNLWNGFAAAEVKRRLGIPYVVSLHCNPDVDSFRGRHGGDWKKRLIGAALQEVEALTLRQADLVLPVYDPVVPYLRRHGVMPPQLRRAAPRVGEVKRNFSDVSKARGRPGWSARVSLDDGLDRTVRWFLAEEGRR